MRTALFVCGIAAAAWLSDSATAPTAAQSTAREGRIEVGMLQNCGHFTYLECPADVHRVFDDFLRGSR